MQFLDIDALFLLVVVLLMICTVAIAALFQVRRVSKLPQQVPGTPAQQGTSAKNAAKNVAGEVAGQAAIALSEMTISSTCDFVSQTQAASSAVAQTREASAEAPVKKSRSAAEVRRAFWRDLLADFRREHTLFGLVLPVPTAVSAKSGRSTHAQRVGLFWLNILIVLCFLLFQYSSVINEIAIAAGSSRSAHVGDLSDDLAARRDGYFGSGFLGIEWDNATWAIAVILIYYVVQISLRCIWWPANYRARRRRRSGHANANDPSCGHVCGWVVVGVLVFILVGLSYFFARGYSSAAYLSLLSFTGYAFFLVWALVQPAVLLGRRLFLAGLESFAPRLYEEWSRALDVCYRWTLGACRKHVCCEGEGDERGAARA